MPDTMQNQEQWMKDEAQQLVALKESPGFQALLNILKEWQRRVFQQFIESTSDKDLIRLSVEGKVLTEIMRRFDGRIQDAAQLSAEQMDQEEFAAERERASIEFHESKRRDRGGF